VARCGWTHVISFEAMLLQCRHTAFRIHTRRPNLSQHCLPGDVKSVRGCVHIVCCTLFIRSVVAGMLCLSTQEAMPNDLLAS